MTQNLDDLDRAIDSVAKRLTHAEGDSLFAARIVSSLPERQSWFGWLAGAWAPRFAALALIALTTILLTNRQSSPTVTPSLLPSSPQTIGAELRASVEASEPLSRTQTLESLEPLQPLELKADHEFSLPALDVEALAPMNMPVGASIDLAPLVVVDLPMTGDFPERY